MIDFKLTIKTESGSNSVTGKAYMKDNQYYYKTSDGNETFSDGETVWGYEKEDNICYINDVEEMSGVNPKDLMTIWEDNFRYQHAKEEVKDGKTIHQIKLYPKDPKKSKFHTVIMYVNGTDNMLQKVYIKRKDAVTIQFIINELKEKVEINDSKFKWNPSKYPGVEEIDDRL